MGRKIILYIAASLDGFIARKDGFVDWLSPYENTEEDYGYKEFYDSVGTVVMGNTTYKGFGEYYRDKPCFVFSRVRKGNDGNATFVNGDMEESMKKINSTGTKNIWLVGGGEVIDAFLRHDLIDELIISIIPTLLGEGIPLIKGGSSESHLDLLTVKKYDSGLVQAHYKIRHRK